MPADTPAQPKTQQDTPDPNPTPSADQQTSPEDHKTDLPPTSPSRQEPADQQEAEVRPYPVPPSAICPTASWPPSVLHLYQTAR
ncbi:hypothetical protein L198_05669 [Cryptococcus wingfieldii CBS 7118]|uniref:Uncharacterized protein n=1 Tax=Cryptococcus wingfieldii CBS 7118 TaxID=1295528 RepID=A0A1E3ITR0_9TREE|nr:hypothetical protein L198_05669 [Cryptococcus wingfieldii CBS 7118]ODN91997.1 hypothetical protein L198_05669 [Cryptococcus wingfieldii CBS 7118]